MKQLTKAQVKKLDQIEKKLKAVNSEIKKAGYTVYLANDTVNIMSGPTHDEQNRPLGENSVRSFIMQGWDGGDW